METIHTDNITLTFDAGHYIKVMEIRGGLTDRSQAVNHPLMGKTIKDKRTGRTGIVTKVVKHHYFGWYYMALVGYKYKLHNGEWSEQLSHASYYVEIDTCINPTIIEEVQKFNTDFVVIENGDSK